VADDLFLVQSVDEKKAKQANVAFKVATEQNFLRKFCVKIEISFTKTKARLA
jgi:hypothetical protein